LLRALVAATRCYAEVPFDVNYVWRYGNESCSHDALKPEDLTERTKRFVRERIGRCAGLPNASMAFVEKSVSNTLRPEFCRAVFPEAKYIALIRDGRDVIQSAVRCWREPPQIGYLVKKLRTFPWLHCASYGRKFLIGAAARSLGLTTRVGTWGPRYPGIDVDFKRLTVHEVCARQWLASIEHFEGARNAFDQNQLFETRYEDLVSCPEEELVRLCDFLEIDDRRSIREYAHQMIQRPPRVLCRPTANQLGQAIELMRPALDRWGYSRLDRMQLAS
jgi:hypothetical protein